MLCRDWGFPLRFDDDRAFLPYNADALVPAWIEHETPTVAWERISVRGFLEVDSTNEEGLDQARRGVSAGTLIYAEKQLKGRGRKGRTWISPAGAGIYCTLVIRPSQPVAFWPLLAHTASVAVALAVKEILQEFVSAADSLAVPDLKWPNDVYLSGRKTAGILLESTAGPGAASAAVVGVGINVRQDSIPEGLFDQATCLSREAGTEIPRRRLMMAFLRYFQQWYLVFERGEHRKLLACWKELSSMWNGVPIWIEDGGNRVAAVTCGLTDLGALRIRNADGIEKTLLAGDVTVRRA